MCRHWPASCFEKSLLCYSSVEGGVKKVPFPELQVLILGWQSNSRHLVPAESSRVIRLCLGKPLRGHGQPISEAHLIESLSGALDGGGELSK